MNRDASAVWLRSACMACALVLGALFAGTAAGADHTSDTLAEVRERLDGEEAVLVDVREQSEWDKGHLAGAVLLPLSELSRWKKQGSKPQAAARLRERLPEDRETIIYCHCASGVRVLPACEILREWGYDVRPLKAGFADLAKAGFRVAPPDEADK